MPIIISGTGTGTGVFEDLLTEFYARGFDYLNQDSAGRTRAERWINEAYLQDVCAQYPWDFLRTSTSGTAPLAVTDVGEVISVVDSTTQSQLSHLDIREQTDDDPTAAAGTPLYWYFSDETTVDVAPSNTSDTISVRYFKVPAEMTAASDSPDVPARWRSLIVDGAVIRAYVDSDNFEAAAALQQRFDAKLQMMVGAELTRTGDAQYIVVTGS